jgi:hypothetical protein
MNLNTPTDIWLGPTSSSDSARQITTGTLDGQRGLCFTPENGIVYAGDHSQNWDLFKADADGGNVEDRDGWEFSWCCSFPWGFEKLRAAVASLDHSSTKSQ